MNDKLFTFKELSAKGMRISRGEKSISRDEKGFPQWNMSQLYSPDISSHPHCDCEDEELTELGYCEFGYDPFDINI